MCIFYGNKPSLFNIIIGQLFVKNKFNKYLSHFFIAK